MHVVIAVKGVGRSERLGEMPMSGKGMTPVGSKADMEKSKLGSSGVVLKKEGVLW